MIILTEAEKKELGNLIRKAKGYQSSEEFAQKIGITKYQLSRIMNGKFKDMPRKSTLQAIYDNAVQSEVKAQLMVCLSPTIWNQVDSKKTERQNNTYETLNAILNINLDNSKKNLLKDYKGIILKELSDVPFEWIRKLDIPPVDITSFTDGYLCIEFLGDSPIKKWHLYFLSSNPDIDDSFLYEFLGKLSCYPSANEDKFSLVVPHMGMYSKIEDWKVNNITTLSTIYLCYEEPDCSDECYITYAKGVDENELFNISIF